MHYTGITGIIRITRITSIIRTYVRPRESRGLVKNGFFFFFLRAPSFVLWLCWSPRFLYIPRTCVCPSLTSSPFFSLPPPPPARVECMQLLCASTHGSSFVSVFSGSSSFLAFSPPLCTSTPLFPLPILLLLVVLPCGPTSGRFNVRDFLTPLILLRPSVLHFLVRLLHLHPLPRPAACPLLAHPPRPVPCSL